MVKKSKSNGKQIQKQELKWNADRCSLASKILICKCRSTARQLTIKPEGNVHKNGL